MNLLHLGMKLSEVGMFGDVSGCLGLFLDVAA